MVMIKLDAEMKAVDAHLLCNLIELLTFNEVQALIKSDDDETYAYITALGRLEETLNRAEVVQPDTKNLIL